MNKAIESLIYDLENSFNNREKYAKIIKTNTDEWAESQKEIIDLYNIIEKLGYNISYNSKKGLFGDEIFTVIVKKVMK